MQIFFNTPRLAWPALALLVLVLVPGCYWLRYYDLMETHVELMESMANNAGWVLETGSRSLTPADIERLRYPLERARQFAEISRNRYAGRESLAAFDSFVAAYEELHQYLDRIRAEPSSSDQLQRAAELLGRVRFAAVRTREFIGSERR